MELRDRMVIKEEDQIPLIKPGTTQAEKALDLQNRNRGNVKTHGIAQLDNNTPQFEMALWLAYFKRKRDKATAHIPGVDRLANTAASWLDGLGIPAYYLNNAFQTAYDCQRHLAEHRKSLTRAQVSNITKLNLIISLDPEFSSERTIKVKDVEKAPGWKIIHSETPKPKTFTDEIG